MIKLTSILKSYIKHDTIKCKFHLLFSDRAKRNASKLSTKILLLFNNANICIYEK